MKIITGYADAREEKEVVECAIEIAKTGERYNLKVSNDGKLRLSAHEGRLTIEPAASNAIELSQERI